MTDISRSMVFDYRALRLLMGIFALSLSFVVSLISASPLTSVSASYHTEARDAFVGMLCIVAAFLWAYNGHSSLEARISKVAGLSAAIVAFAPTACDSCKWSITSIVHWVASAILFVILAFFCFVPFRRRTKGMSGKKGRRGTVYLLCGWVMVVCLVGLLAAKLALPEETVQALRITYWAEAIALCAFGVAWIVAGKYIRLFVDEEEALPQFFQ